MWAAEGKGRLWGGCSRSSPSHRALLPSNVAHESSTAWPRGHCGCLGDQDRWVRRQKPANKYIVPRQVAMRGCSVVKEGGLVKSGTDMGAPPQGWVVGEGCSDEELSEERFD